MFRGRIVVPCVFVALMVILAFGSGVASAENSFGGEAVGLSVTQPSTPDYTAADTGALPGSGGSLSSSVVSASDSGDASTGPLTASVTGGGDQAQAGSSAQTASVLGGLVSADSVTTGATASCNGVVPQVSDTGLSILGLPVSGTLTPNTEVTLPGVGYAIINQQTSSAQSMSAVGIAVYVTLSTPLAPVGTVVDIASSSAQINCLATPSISTSQQPASVTVGGLIADQATVSGGDSPTGTITFNLYNNPNATGTPLFTDANVALVSGTATSTQYTATGTGTDYWVATYNGNANNSSVSSSAAGEPVTITSASKLADLSITISGPSSAADGSSFSEQVTVKNVGPANAGNVLSVMLVPNGTTVTSTGGGSLGFGEVYWTASQIKTGAKVTYTVTFKVSAHASGHVLISAATASLVNPDPSYANNATATTVTLGGKTA